MTDQVGRASPIAVDAVAAAEAEAEAAEAGAEAETNPTSYSSNPALFPTS